MNLTPTACGCQLHTDGLDEIAQADRLPSVKTVSESLRIAAALMCSTDPDDVGLHVENNPKSAAFLIFLADHAAGGNGLTQEVYGQRMPLIAGALRILEECPHCKDHPDSRGCARCVTTPWGSDADVCRVGAILILRKLIAAFTKRMGSKT